MRPVIALLTDFGTRDHYAGTLKGVVLGICPDATLVDITHDIPPHDVLGRRARAGGLLSLLSQPAPSSSWSSIPASARARRGIAAEAGDYRFVAPDNGVLTAVFRDTPPKRVVELTERKYARPTVSRTFEGRDRFAPAAGWLAKGIELARFGRPVDRLPACSTMPEPALDGGSRRRRGAAGRSLRQPGHQHRPPDVRPGRAAAGRCRSPSGRTRWRGW